MINTGTSTGITKDDVFLGFVCAFFWLWVSFFFWVGGLLCVCGWFWFLCVCVCVIIIWTLTGAFLFFLPLPNKGFRYRFYLVVYFYNIFLYLCKGKLNVFTTWKGSCGCFRFLWNLITVA